MKEKTTPTQKALNLWAIILIIWSVYRSFLKMPEWFDELVAKPLVFVLPVFYYIVKIDKKPLLSSLLINLKPKKILGDFLYSLILAAIFLGAGALALYLKFKNIILPILPQGNQIFLIVILAIATGITEEILSRGFVLKMLNDEAKNYFSSIFISSILFFILHIPILFANAKITGNLLLAFMATDMVLSIINGYLFLERKSLLPPILIHAFYNIMVSLLFL